MYRTVDNICAKQWPLYVPHCGHYMYSPVVTICATSLTFTTLRSVHTLYLCVLCGSQNKQPLFPYTTLTVWFLDAIIKLLKPAISVCMSLCLSVCLSVCTSVSPPAWNNSAPAEWIFTKFDIELFFENPSRIFNFH